MRTIKCPLVLTDNEYSLIINIIASLVGLKKQIDWTRQIHRCC